MKYRGLLTLLLVVVMFFPLSTAVFAEEAGETFYVDSENGDDTNDGLSPKAPFRSMKKAFDRALKPGTTVLFRKGGIYQGGDITMNALISSSGTDRAPITLSSYGTGDNPILTTEVDEAILTITGSYIEISGLDFVTSNRFGVTVFCCNGNDIHNVCIDNCRFYDSAPQKPTVNIVSSILFLYSDGTARAFDCTFKNLEVFHCAYGISTDGITFESNLGFTTPEESYHTNIVFDNIYCHDIWCGGLVLGALYDSVVRNSRFIRCAQEVPFAVAAVWTRACDHVTIEYSEIAGSTNLIDGMAIDFDGWSTNCTYRYIYSHDNTRFMRNCVYDGTTTNRGCTVDHCLSVNDNRFPNMAALPLVSATSIKVNTSDFGFVMDHFTFTDNYLIDCSPFFFGNLTNAEITGNYFGGRSVLTSIASFARSMTSAVCQGNVKNNTYYHYTPIMRSDNRITRESISAESAYRILFPNGVHTECGS